jgi:hypothetical protein
MRTGSQIDAQKVAAINAKNTASQESAISGLPPAFIAGFRVVYQPDHNVTIEPGLANVAGYRVTHSETYTLKLSDEQVEMLTASWRYIYIDRGGRFYVDNLQPTFNATYGADYHKSQPWRFLGRMYITDDGYTKYAGRGWY